MLSTTAVDQTPSQITINIENVVATAKINQTLNLKKIIKKLSGVQYNPKKFPGVIMRLEYPKSVILFFSTGNIVCTGATSIEKTRKAFETFVDILRKHVTSEIMFSDVKIQNIVSSANLGRKIHLEKAARTLPKSLYEPEQFPGIIHRLYHPKTVILLFASGKLVCTGGKTMQDIHSSIHGINSILQEKDLMI